MGKEKNEKVVSFREAQVGDTVIRWLGGEIPHRLTVTKITDALIICSAWEFDRVTGAEVDSALVWGPPPGMTGSYLE